MSHDGSSEHDALVRELATTDLARPLGLSEAGKRAWEAVVRLLVERGLTHTGGCRAFYRPVEWKGLGHEFGLTSDLIVVYDGGDLRAAFTLDERCYVLVEQMQAALGQAGCRLEECTRWYSAVYAKP